LLQSFKEGSTINQMKIQLLKHDLCLLQALESFLWLKKKKKKNLFEMLQEQELQLEQQEEYLIGKIEELKALNEEHDKLKHSHTSLIGKHENLEKEYACATNVSSCVDPLKNENTNFKAQLEVLTSKHVKMQKIL
jgi:nitroimidazol reductase NimA-like FMN-containing flavoprotein (pyridoxamine 5'-phosphate oxidase superfamily)